jgi:hypothetical protein
MVKTKYYSDQVEKQQAHEMLITKVKTPHKDANHDTLVK